MRKVAKALAVLGMALLLMGCSGGKEQSVTLTTEESGMLQEMVLDAKGDLVTKITQTSTVEIGELEEAQIEYVKEEIQKAKENFEAYEGADYEYDLSDTTLKETITVDMTDTDTVDKLADDGLLPIEGNASKISLEKTKEGLISGGWTVKE